MPPYIREIKMADGNQEIDLDKESRLFPQNDTGGEVTDMDRGGELADFSAQDAARQERGSDYDRAQDPEYDREYDRESDPERRPMQPPLEEEPYSLADLALPKEYQTVPEVAADFEAIAREHKLSKEAAQALIDLDVQRLQVQTEQHNRQRLAWREQIKQDDEYGKANFNRTLRSARTALLRFDPSGEVKQLLNLTGGGDHPAIIKMFAKINAAIAEDEFISGSGSNNKQKSLAERLWPQG